MSELRVVSTDRAPAAIGPYSQAIVCDRWIFVSGQIPLHAATGELEVGTIADQTERVLQNLSEVLEASGGGLGSVVKTTVYLSDMENFSAMNEVYARYFNGHEPARSTVQAARLPRDVAVEIDAVARVTG